MKFLYTTMAVLGGALMLSGCAMETMDMGGDEDEPEAVSESESPLTTTNKRLRNAATSSCLLRDTALAVISAGPCSNTLTHFRWDITDHGGGRHSIRPTSDTTLCLQSLVPTPNQPTVGPCAGGPMAMQAAGQLFRLLPVPAIANTYRITPHPLVNPPSSRLYVTAAQPFVNFLDYPAAPPAATQTWLVY